MPEDAAAIRRTPIFMKQANMRRVLCALAPLAPAGVYFFGWRSAAVLAAVFAAGLVTERITSRSRGKPISMACLVTCSLFALSLPPTVSYLAAVVGTVVAILFGKEVFGGFGRNFANPALVGRAFVYVCFPKQLTAGFVPAFDGFPGGFAHWSFESLSSLPGRLAETGMGAADAVSQASPMWVHRAVGPEAAGKAASLWQLTTGAISGTYENAGQTGLLAAGSIGEGCALLIVLAAIYLLLTKTANWRLMLGGFIGVVGATVLFRYGLGGSEWTVGRPAVAPLPFALTAGSTLFVLVFMVTDPVSAPERNPAMFVYGAVIGLLMVLLRWKGIFVAATTFAVLSGNLLAPLLDMAATAWAGRGKEAG